MANNRPMTEDEKKLLQAQHRMEAIEARNRQKERKARTRRLIQMGAVLESVFPEVQTTLGSCRVRRKDKGQPTGERACGCFAIRTVFG